MEQFIYWVIAVAIFLFYPTWRISKRAGLNPTISLLAFIPYIGIFIFGLIVGYSKWNHISSAGNE